jgi:hypothetical protein
MKIEALRLFLAKKTGGKASATGREFGRKEQPMANYMYV